MKCGGRFEVWLQTLLAENAKIVGINWRVWQLKKVVDFTLILKSIGTELNVKQ